MVVDYLSMSSVNVAILLRHASYSITMNVYDEAMSEEKRNAHRGVIQQLNRSVTRSAPKPAIPQIVDNVGVPDGI